MNVRGRWWPRLAAIALVLVQVPVVVRTATDTTQSDFANYFAPAFALVTQRDLAGLYERDGFERAMTAAGLSGLGSFVPHPPANALWLAPLVGLTPPMAKGVWTLVLVFSLAVSAWMLRRLGNETWLAVLIVIAPVLALRNAVAFGQPYPILAALLIGGTVALSRGRPGFGGFLLGLGVSFKPYALGVGVLFLHRDRLRSLAGFVCGSLGPSLVLLSLVGAEPFVEFGTRVLPWMARGDIQDPFASGWGSVSALSNRLFRFEPDLNPAPWWEAPRLASLLAAGVAAALVGVGLVGGRRFLEQGKAAESVGAVIAFSLVASPFVASYHLVLLCLPIAAVAARFRGRALSVWLLAWALTGSAAVNVFRTFHDAPAPLHFIRLFALLGLAAVVVRPVWDRSLMKAPAVMALVAGLSSLGLEPREEAWPRVAEVRGYAAFRPHFCGSSLRWWSPRADGRGLEMRGEGAPCLSENTLGPNGPGVASRFTHGSWNLYLRAAPTEPELRLTFSEANELDPVLSPDRCDVVFASDQGRGLGSTTLYRLDVSALIASCEKGRPASRRP